MYLAIHRRNSVAEAFNASAAGAGVAAFFVLDESVGIRSVHAAAVQGSPKIMDTHRP